MAYYNPYMNNPYLNYQFPPIPQPIQQTVQQTVQQPQSNVIWVKNMMEAQNYPVSAGNTVMLMDNDNPVVYKKSADLSGRALPLEVYDLVKREAVAEEEPHQINLEEYLTRSEFNSYASEINNRLSKISMEESDDNIEDDDDEEEVRPVRRRRGRKA